MDTSAMTTNANDPVCGMTVDVPASADAAAHEARTYHFGSARFPKQFQADPGRYKGKSSAAAAMALSSLLLILYSAPIKRQKFWPHLKWRRSCFDS